MVLNLAAVIVMGGYVVAIVAAALLLALRPGGRMVAVASGSLPPASEAGRRDEILLGSEADSLGTPSGRVQAVLVHPATLHLEALALSRGAGLLDEQLVGAEFLTGADGQSVHLAESWSPAEDTVSAGAVSLRNGMSVVASDRKRLGRLRVVCIDRDTKTVIALGVTGGRSAPSVRLVPAHRVQRIGPNRIVAGLTASDWTGLQLYASDAAIRQAVLDQLEADSTLRPFQPSFEVDVTDQQVRLVAYVSTREQAERAAQLAAGVPGVIRVDPGVYSDEQLAQEVTDAIAKDSATSRARVQVRSRFGKVAIVGVAPDAAGARAVEDLAMRIPGVLAVHNITTVESRVATA